MLFFGAFTLLVLPLFLLVCINMIKQSSWYENAWAKVLIALFYIAIFTAIGLALYFFTRIIGEAGDNLNTFG